MNSACQASAADLMKVLAGHQLVDGGTLGVWSLESFVEGLFSDKFAMESLSNLTAEHVMLLTGCDCTGKDFSGLSLLKPKQLD